KKWGTAPVVAWARALGQAIGTKALSTDGRIAALFEAGKLQRSEVQRYREAFDLVQRFRLRAQLTSVGQDNLLNLDALSLHDVQKLTDALATLTHLRQSVGLSFRI
ncbi:MAG: putative nucleotidyltransferase substrate binding domain-containing protein, partial [Limnohabitans sp.]